MTDNPNLGPQAAPHVTQSAKPSPSKLLKRLGCLGVLALLAAIVLSTLPRPGSSPPSRRSQCANNLKQIGLAFHNYELTYHGLPPAYTVDAMGRPLHSWRTLILPFLEQQSLYDTIDLTKPWDDPVNAEAYKTVIPCYQCPTVQEATTLTSYLAVATWDGCFRPKEPRPLSEIEDGLSETILVLEVPAVHAAHWMSPLDADERVVQGLGPEVEWPHPGAHQVLLADGSVRALSATLPAEVRRALISIAGNEQVGDY